MKRIPAILSMVALADVLQSKGTPPAEIFLPFGPLEYTKGDTRGVLNVDPAFADAVIADFKRRGKELVIDYEHQTLTGEVAPAAGWIDQITKTSAGIALRVRSWTSRAAGMLAEGEYKYHSPVVYNPEGRPGFHSFALTNHPALNGRACLVAVDDDPISDKQENPEPAPMKETLEALSKKLGITVTALADGAPDVKTTLAAIMGKMDEMCMSLSNLKAFLSMHDCKDLDTVTLKIKGMVPAAEKTALSDELAGMKAEKAVAVAMTDGKITEAQREWAVGYAKKDPQGFADYVAKAGKVAPGPATTVGTGGQPPAGAVALTDAQKKIYRNSGIDPETVGK